MVFALSFGKASGIYERRSNDVVLSADLVRSIRLVKSSKCPHCRTKLPEGFRIHAECVEGWWTAQAAKRKAQAERAAAKRRKVDRATDRARRRALETIPELIKAADKEFAAFIRLRDRLAGHPCVSSGRPLDWSGNQVDAGHYLSRGARSHLRYNEDNCHAQSKHDNQFRAGNVVAYRINLIKRIGIERVEALESNYEVHKWQADELRAIRETYKAKRKALEE